MSKTQQIAEKLEAAFTPRALEVVDDSESHRGHAGHREGGETHFNVHMRSERFKGMGRVARHRAVHAALGAQLIADIHALALDLDE